MSLSLASFFFLNYVDHVRNRKQQHLFLSPLVCLFVFLIKFAATLTNIITYGKKDFQKTSILLLPDSFQKKLPFSDYDLARVLLADLSITCSRNKKNYVHHVLCNMLMSCNWSIYANVFFCRDMCSRIDRAHLASESKDWRRVSSDVSLLFILL